MKALGLSFSVFVFAALAAPPAEAGFRACFFTRRRASGRRMAGAPGTKMAPAAAIGTGASGSIRPASGPTALPKLRRNTCPCLCLSRSPTT